MLLKQKLHKVKCILMIIIFIIDSTKDQFSGLNSKGVRHFFAWNVYIKQKRIN